MDIERFKKQDFVITLVLGVLLFIGTLIIYATTYNTPESDLVIKQLVLIVLGLSAYYLISILDLEWLKILSIQIILYSFIIGTLLYVNIFGSTIAGTNRWIDFGFFAFQPSEYAKVLIILFISLLFSKSFFPKKEKLEDFNVTRIHTSTFGKTINNLYIRLKEDREIKLLFIAFAYLFPIIVLTFIQPALGNTIIVIALATLSIFFSISSRQTILKYSILIASVAFLAKDYFSLNLDNGRFIFAYDTVHFFQVFLLILTVVLTYYLSKVKLISIVVTLLFTIVFITLAFNTWNNILGNYQRERILTFVEGPETDPLGSGYQIIQSKIAIGSGQLLGRGFLQGTQSSLHILTQAHTDFAFAAMSEQFGFVGSLMVLLIYLFLILRILKVARETKDDFGRNICFGATSLLLIHIFINIGMNMGKLPVTGIPLPLISYGGSSVLMTLIIMGLVQAVYASRKPVDMADSLMLTSIKSS
jgi:rod shape determining protein RodA